MLLDVLKVLAVMGAMIGWGAFMYWVSKFFDRA